MHRMLLAAVLAVGSLAATAAQAITFDFTTIPRGTPAASAFVMTVDGLRVIVTAGSYKPGEAATSHNGELVNFSGRNYGIGENGLGVDARGIDGSGTWKDVILFSFSSKVVFTGIRFSYFDHNGVLSNFEFFSELGDSGSLFGGGATGIPASGVVLFALGLFGDQFGIGAPGERDQFKIHSISVDPATVPLPAALPLLGGALLAAGAVRRRRRAA
jgi:hypothetical protein